MTDFLAILIVGGGTYLMRAVFIVSLAKKRIPDAVLVPLRYVGAAVLAALIVGLLADAEGEVGIRPAELGGLVAAGVVAHRTRSQVWTLLAGMAVYWLVRALL